MKCDNCIVGYYLTKKISDNDYMGQFSFEKSDRNLYEVFFKFCPICGREVKFINQDDLLIYAP